MKAKTILKLTLLVAAMFTITTAFSIEGAELNNGPVTGQVLDASTKAPIEYASIAIYSLTDSLLVTGIVNDMDGRFNVKNLNPGSYYIQINFIGFEKAQIPNFTLSRGSKDLDLGVIHIRETNAIIGEVVVTAERSRVEYKIDKRVVNVDKEFSAKGGTAASVLENTPSVQVDPQGNVTLRGSSNFIVLIDGKPSSIKGSDALKQIPSSAIKQIEVITNPSAKYEADGQAGIINVIMQKDRLQGLSGNINLGAGNLHKRNGNALISYNVMRIEYFFTPNYLTEKSQIFNSHRVKFLY